jgi:hypothetical protein
VLVTTRVGHRASEVLSPQPNLLDPTNRLLRAGTDATAYRVLAVGMTPVRTKSPIKY